MPAGSASVDDFTAAEKLGNRRRRGYELTRQRNMVPIALGAATAAVVIHLLVYCFFPDTFRLGLARYFVPPRVDDAEMRVVVRDAPEEEIQVDAGTEVQEPQEMDEISYEPDEVDILDAKIEELEIAPGETQSVIDMPSPFEAEDAEEEPAPPSQMDMQAISMQPLQMEAVSLNEPVPVNMNETAVKPAADIQEAADALEADLRNSAADKGGLPADTKALSELLGERELGAKSGVARLGADLLFGFDECKLRNSARVSMLQLAALIQKNPETCFLIEGHTDSIGTKEYNALLGLQRAAAVRAWLQGNGIPTDRVYIRSCGNNAPLAAITGDRDKEALNRRVEIHMRKLGETIPAGFLPASHTVDTGKPVAAQLAAGVQIPAPAAQAVPPPTRKKAAAPAAPAELIPAPQGVDTGAARKDDIPAPKKETAPAAKPVSKPAPKPAAPKAKSSKPAAKQPTRKPAAKPAPKKPAKSSKPAPKKPAHAKRR